MRRHPGTVLAAAAALVALQTALPAQAPPAQRLRSGVDLVLVDMVVVDRGGRPLHGLRQEDFQVFEDGRPKPIESFIEISADAGDQDGRLVAILLDDVSVSPTLTVRVKSIARGFVERMGPHDEIGIVKLNGDTGRTTRDREALLGQIDGYLPGVGVGLGGRWGEHTLDTIADLAAQFAAAEHPRKTLVCIGSSSLFNVREPEPSAFGLVRPSWFDALRAAARHNVSVYVIDPRGLSASDEGFDSGGLALETGGLSFQTNMFDRAVDRIWREAGNYYLLGYAATPERTGEKTRRIKVRTTRDGVTIRARRAIG